MDSRLKFMFGRCVSIGRRIQSMEIKNVNRSNVTRSPVPVYQVLGKGTMFEERKCKIRSSRCVRVCEGGTRAYVTSNFNILFMHSAMPFSIPPKFCFVQIENTFTFQNKATKWQQHKIKQSNALTDEYVYQKWTLFRNMHADKINEWIPARARARLANAPHSCQSYRKAKTNSRQTQFNMYFRVGNKFSHVDAISLALCPRSGAHHSWWVPNSR